MKWKIPLSPQQALLIRLGCFLLLITCISRAHARIITYFEYDFNISVYRVIVTANSVDSQCFNLGKLLYGASVCLVSQGKWIWRSADNDDFSLPLHDPAGLELKLMRLNNMKGYIFKLVVRETFKNPANDGKKRIFFQKRMDFPHSGINCWYFTYTPGEKMYFIVVETIRREFNEPWPEYNFVRKIIPPYPTLALIKNIEGRVTVMAVTDIYGRMVAVKATEGHPLLKEAAVEAVKKWIIEPYILSGVPRPFSFKIIFHFKLQK